LTIKDEIYMPPKNNNILFHQDVSTQRAAEVDEWSGYIMSFGKRMKVGRKKRSKEKKKKSHVIKCPGLRRRGDPKGKEGRSRCSFYA
jgi:hypothetical protein